MVMDDHITARISKIMEHERGPMGTPEILSRLNGVTRTKALYRLHCLRAEGAINGRRLNAGAKGVWVWWGSAPPKRKSAHA